MNEKPEGKAIEKGGCRVLFGEGGGGGGGVSVCGE